MKNIDEFIFVRHGETDYNAQRIMQFHVNAPLNDKGRAQAKMAGQIIASQARGSYYLATSPADRAVTTATICGNEFFNNIACCHEYVDLQERFGGSLDLMPFDKFMKIANKKIPKGLDIWDNLHFVCPKAESSADVNDRIKKTIQKCYSEAQKINAMLIVMGYYGAMHTFSRHELAIPQVELFKNATPYLFKQINNQWTITEISI